MTTPNENKQAPSTPIVDPFPKPNTIPSGWDVSAFKENERPDSKDKTMHTMKSDNHNVELK